MPNFMVGEGVREDQAQSVRFLVEQMITSGLVMKAQRHTPAMVVHESLGTRYKIEEN